MKDRSVGTGGESAAEFRVILPPRFPHYDRGLISTRGKFDREPSTGDVIRVSMSLGESVANSVAGLIVVSTIRAVFPRT